MTGRELMFESNHNLKKNLITIFKYKTSFFSGEGHLPSSGFVFLPQRTPQLGRPAEKENCRKILQASIGGHVREDWVVTQRRLRKNWVVTEGCVRKDWVLTQRR